MEMDYSAAANESGIGAVANESGIGDQVGSSAFPTVPRKSASKWSVVWDEFSMLNAQELKDYEEKLGITRTRERAKCMHCGKVLIAESKSGMVTLGRHLERCPERPNNLNELGGNRNIDHNVCREMIAEAVIEHGYPFEWVEHKKTRDLCYYLNKKFKPVCRNTCLDVIRESLVKVRNCVKHVEGSEARKIKFRECVVQAGLSYSRGLWLDVATRWNSTYLILERFMFYHSAFRNSARADQTFSFLLPDEREFPWLESIFTFLKPFYDITNLFSGRDYPTANLYFENVWQIQRNIDKELISQDPIMREMATTMKEKFSKYWDEHTLVLSFAAILDPRFKIQFLQYTLPLLGTQYANRAECILVQMKLMFEEYQSKNGIFPESSVLNDNVEQAGRQRRVISQDMCGFSQFDFQSNSTRSELDIYLGEAREDYNKEIDILDYWKNNQSRFPILSRMAMDLLCIPITTVASKSTFSMGGRVINKWRNCLLTENAEMLITTRNWLYGCEVEENAATVFGRGIAKV
ncbi:putative Zinc finger, BED-type [Corchorus capsularis]|uniref:Putative Zinc finger, BED-type n=1 Tax=Corchorus capsularis TaxID=210143 RepID=A0A1R3HN20_COCAP|nr:putative Zinc finger, BED-type [Corchorus capsularis]